MLAYNLLSDFRPHPWTVEWHQSLFFFFEGGGLFNVIMFISYEKEKQFKMIWFRDVSVQHNLEPFLYNMIQSHFSVIQRWFNLIWLRAVFDYWIFRYNMIQGVFGMIGLELFDTIWFRDILIWCDSEVFRSSLIQSHFKRIQFRTFF